MLPQHLKATSIQKKVLARQIRSGNPVVNHLRVRVPKWRALQLEKRRLLSQFRKSYRERTHLTEADIIARAMANVDNIYKRRAK